MALRYSTGARNFMASYGSFADAFNNGRIEIYTGLQPASANDAATGTLLCTITNNSAAHTREVAHEVTLTHSSGDPTLTANASRSIVWNASQTFNFTTPCFGAAGLTVDTYITKLVDHLNSQRPGQLRYRAFKVSTTQFKVVSLPGVNNGAPLSINGEIAFSGSQTVAAGAPANGLLFNPPVGNKIAKLSGQNWTGVNVAAGDAGWYRFYGSRADTGALDSAGVHIREDGAIATTGAELNMTSIALALNATTTISAWERTLPLA